MRHVKSYARSWSGMLIVCIIVAAVGIIVVDHWAHIFGYLPYLLLLSCPLLHIFMHRGHHGGSETDKTSQTNNDPTATK